MTTRDSLLAQILADPSDAAARSVYADHLLASGEPRGELIAVEDQLARAPSAELAARRAVLLDQHAARWWPGVERGWVRTRGGFVEGVAAHFTRLPPDALFATEPIHELELVGDFADALPDAPWHAQITRLAVRAWFHPDFRLGMLAASRLGRSVVALDLANCLLHPDGVLGAALPRCRHLNLAGNSLGRTLGELFAWAHAGELQTLDLARCDLDPGALGALLVRDLHSLRWLRLSGNALGDNGARMLRDRQRFALPALERLEMIDCEVGGDGRQALVDLTTPSLAVIHEPAQLASRQRLDLFGATLELVHRDGAIDVLLDGQPAVTRWRKIASDSRHLTQVKRDWTDGPAPLGPLTHALAIGASRKLVPGGAEVVLESYSGAAYNTSVSSTETARIAITEGRGIAIELDSHVSIDD